jgi:hypothetical protein
MIQRIQSLFLLLAGASFFGLFGLPMASSSISMEGIFSDQLYNLFDNPFLIGLCIIGGLMAIINIFLFKNRPLQKKIGYVVITMAILFIVAALLLVLQDDSSDVMGEINEGFGLGLPIFAIIFTLFANRYIGKDDKLVKSMDRLR